MLCPCWPGNGSRGAVRRRAAAAALGARARRPDRRVARRHRLHHAVTYMGASLGGLVGIAFAVRHPERCARLVTISAGLRPDGWGTATRHLQRELVRDGLRTGDVATGMMRARQLGMLTYRGRDELDTRFGVLAPDLALPPVAGVSRSPRPAVRGAVSGAHVPAAVGGDRSVAVRRRSAAVRAALARVTAEVIVVGVPGDLLFPYALQHELYRELQAVGATCSLWKLDSEYGHDAFLAEQERLAALLRDAGVVRRPRTSRGRGSKVSARGRCARSGSA